MVAMMVVGRGRDSGGRGGDGDDGGEEGHQVKNRICPRRIFSYFFFVVVVVSWLSWLLS